MRLLWAKRLRRQEAASEQERFRAKAKRFEEWSKKRAVVELEMPAYLEEEMPAYHPNRNFWLVVMRESQRLGTYNVQELCKAQMYIQEWLTEAKAFILECQRLIDEANNNEQQLTLLLEKHDLLEKAREDVAILEDKLEDVTNLLRKQRAAEEALEEQKKEASSCRRILPSINLSS